MHYSIVKSALFSYIIFCPKYNLYGKFYLYMIILFPTEDYSSIRYKIGENKYTIMNTELFTRRIQTDYEQIVDLFITHTSNSIPDINDSTTCKLVILNKGTLSLSKAESDKTNTITIKSPAAIFLSNQESIQIGNECTFNASTIFFKPTTVNESFHYERIYNNEFEGLYGTIIYQDYLNIRNFVMKDDTILKCCHLSDSSLINISDLIQKMEHELHVQYDDFWPCRSRSYFLEILFFLNFCYTNNPYTLETNSGFVTSVIEYFNKHIDERITLDTLTSTFHVNRNYLNQAFTKDTGLTSLAYLLKLRMDLAKIWLTKTEIPVQEIARRLSYYDQNYFSKTFKKETGQTPSQYRLEKSTYFN